MPTFPLKILPSVPWLKVPGSKNTYFGAGRNNGYPIHGACDLMAPAGSDVLAVDDGEIIRSYAFYEDKNNDGCARQTWALDVKHTNFIARYCEIDHQLANDLKAGDVVQEGDVIATVARQCGDSMLHFEMFKDTDRLDYLTNQSADTKYPYVPQANYQRRSDLLDPTSYLNAWSWDLRVKLHRTMDISMYEKRGRGAS